MIAAPMDVSSIGLEEKVELGVYQSSLNLIQLQEGFFRPKTTLVHVVKDSMDVRRFH